MSRAYDGSLVSNEIGGDAILQHINVNILIIKKLSIFLFNTVNYKPVNIKKEKLSFSCHQILFRIIMEARFHHYGASMACVMRKNFLLLLFERKCIYNFSSYI